MELIKAPGSYNIPEGDYHADPVAVPSLSRSTIRTLLNECPMIAKMKHPRLNPEFKEEQSGKFDLGTAAHALLLEGPDKVAVVQADDWRTNAAKAKRDEAYAAGMTPLLQKDFERAQEMAQVAEKCLYRCKELGISDIRKDCDTELSLIWKEDNGVWCRVRPDIITKDRAVIVDYKTTGLTANPENKGKDIDNAGLELQDAFYRRGTRALFDGVDPVFAFLFQENEPPYMCSIVALIPEAQEMGDEEVEAGINIWKNCLDGNSWPGYPVDRIAWVSLPPYARARWEARKGGIS